MRVKKRLGRGADSTSGLMEGGVNMPPWRVQRPCHFLSPDGRPTRRRRPERVMFACSLGISRLLVLILALWPHWRLVHQAGLRFLYNTGQHGARAPGRVRVRIPHPGPALGDRGGCACACRSVFLFVRPFLLSNHSSLVPLASSNAGRILPWFVVCVSSSDDRTPARGEGTGTRERGKWI